MTTRVDEACAAGPRILTTRSCTPNGGRIPRRGSRLTDGASAARRVMVYSAQRHLAGGPRGASRAAGGGGTDVPAGDQGAWSAEVRAGGSTCVIGHATRRGGGDGGRNTPDSVGSGGAGGVATLQVATRKTLLPDTLRVSDACGRSRRSKPLPNVKAPPTDDLLRHAKRQTPVTEMAPDGTSCGG